MPATIEDLEAAIQDTISQANSILFLNHNILEEYEECQQKVVGWHLSFFLSCLLDDGLSIIAFNLQIEAISTKLEADEKELRMYLAEINALKVKMFSSLLTFLNVYTVASLPNSLSRT